MPRHLTTGRISELSACPVRYLHSRECHSALPTRTPYVASAAFLSRRLDASCSLYQKDLHAHFGCVNAIEFSSEGDLLVSGGDDKRVLLWHVESALSGKLQPRAMKGEHNSNIFCLCFDSQNTKVFSAGNDEKVMVHDLVTGETLDLFLHQDAVYGVSVNPLVNTVFASAGEDGQVLLYDIRAPPSANPLVLSRCLAAFHAVQFHPVEPAYVVTANSKEGVALWDVRKPRTPALRYGEKRSTQSSMCARFNRSGTQIIALRRRLPPVLYDTHSPMHVCQFDAEHYYNSCTMKSCCFAGNRDQYVLSGSDDFNLYLWRLPEENSGVQFVSEAHMVLRGHRSIVNQVRFNSQNFIIASSGVEKIVKLWSGLELPGSTGDLKGGGSNSMTRRVYTHEEYIGLVMASGQNVSHDYSQGDMGEDPCMMAFFDSLVQREVEGWTSNTDLSDDADMDSQLVGQNSEETEANTSSPLPTSQSDDNNSGESEAEEESQAEETAKVSNVRLHLRRQASRQLDTHRQETVEEEEDNSRSNGSSNWILRLIAKKRAHLKAAQMARKRQKHLRRKKNHQARHFLRALNSNRGYLYRPSCGVTDALQPSETISGIAPLSNGSSVNSCRTRQRRQFVAPYTVMVVQDGDHESDYNDGDEEDEDEEEEEEEEEVENRGNVNTTVSIDQTESSVRNTNNVPVSVNQVIDYSAKIWSSGSSCCSDDEHPSRDCKHNHAQVSDSDSDLCVFTKHSNNGPISDIIESEDSDIEMEHTLITGEDSLNVGSSLTSNVNNINDLNPSPSHAGFEISENYRSNHGDSDAVLENGVNEVVPISTISTDENGSLLFDLDQNSLGANLGLQDNVDIYLPNTPNCKVVQNGTTTHVANGTSALSTPDSGILVLPSSAEKSEDESQSCSSVSSSQSQLGHTYTFKKIPKCNLKNYRSRQEDDF